MRLDLDHRRIHQCALRRLVPVAVVACILANPAPATEIDYAELSLEALTSLEIVSVSKQPEQKSDAAAAVYVITADAIRRSGATSVPELFRLVPGMHAVRLDAARWAVTARGFNGWFANKLLVLVDGRSAYEPLFSGVFWESIGVALDDIERIEVIRGPGATLWGANAMNGVINIITRRSEDTQGVLASAALGNEDRVKGTLRVGQRLGHNASMRVTAEYADRDDSIDEYGDDASDGRILRRVTSRLDWRLGTADEILLTGHIHDGPAPTVYFAPLLTPPYRRPVPSPFETRSSAGTIRWSHAFSPASQFELQFFHSSVSVVDSLTTMDQRTSDLELRHSWMISADHDLVWGGGYRVTSDDIQDALTTFEPASETVELANFFIQDRWALWPGRLRLILGTKFELFESASNELQPNLRLSWTLSSTNTVWAAASRAVRTPSRYERSVRIDANVFPPNSELNPTPLAALLEARGQDGLPVERLNAYELGYRLLPHATMSLDLALFYHDYDDLRSLRLGELEVRTEPVAHVAAPTFFDHQVAGETWGAELAADWRVRPWWRLHSGLTYLGEDLAVAGSFPESSVNYISTVSPELRWSLVSQADVGDDVEVDFWLEYVGELKTRDVDAAWKLDARLAWRPTDNVEISAVGQRLLEPECKEFVNVFIVSRPAWMQRSFYGKVTVWF